MNFLKFSLLKAASDVLAAFCVLGKMEKRGETLSKKTPFPSTEYDKSCRMSVL